jgi:CopA family copper-resistance protein
MTRKYLERVRARDDTARAGSVNRRQFVLGLAGAASFPAGLVTAHAEPRSQGARPTALTGDQIDLVIAQTSFNVTGRPRVATSVNGMVPGPTLRLREGDTVTIAVTNRMPEPTSIHWHGLRLPADQDGVPGLTFRGIGPGETFTYRFPIKQSGTYWYHSHSAMQEQTGLIGPLILVPREPESYAYDREYVVMLSDWTDQDPMTVLSNLKQQSDYYNFRQRTFGTFIHDVHREGLGATVKDRLLWGGMRMSPTDIMDVTGATYTFLLNGQPPGSNWTGIFRPGEKVRLRFINGSAMTTFDVRIPGLKLTVVAADGSDIEPVRVDEFRIGVAETYDVSVTPPDSAAYTVFAQAEDRSGYARGTLAPRAGMEGTIPPLDPRPLRTMADMGMAMGPAMAGMAGSKSADSQRDMSHMDMSHMDMSDKDMANMPGMDMSNISAKEPSRKAAAVSGPPAINADGVDPKRLKGEPFVESVAAHPRNRLAEPGDGLDGNGRRVLVYADLKALRPDPDMRVPARNIEFHLTGNMERFVWGFDGLKFSEVGPVRVPLGERVRFILINDTMMEHPIHLHGFLFSLENGQEGRLPLKHTINVKPGERLSFLFAADTPGHWAFHCHLLYHQDSGMFRTVLVA